MKVKEMVERKLTNALQPTKLDVVDESSLHKGHSGWREGGETHFRVDIVASKFSGLSRLDRHRLINDLLKDELQGGIHALAIRASAPEELK